MIDSPDFAGYLLPMRCGIVLIGPTGSGKTPLGEALEARGFRGKKCFHFDFGANLRRAAAGELPAGTLNREEIGFVEDVLRSGALLEDEQFHIARKVLECFLAGRILSDDDIIVLNGLPRHVGQAREVDSIIKIDMVIQLVCTPETVFERIRTNIGTDRIGRNDDSIKAVRSKLDVFIARTAPLIDHYRRLDVSVRAIGVTPASSAADMWEILNLEK